MDDDEASRCGNGQGNGKPGGGGLDALASQISDAVIQSYMNGSGGNPNGTRRPGPYNTTVTYNGSDLNIRIYPSRYRFPGGGCYPSISISACNGNGTDNAGKDLNGLGDSVEYVALKVMKKLVEVGIDVYDLSVVVNGNKCYRAHALRIHPAELVVAGP